MTGDSDTAGYTVNNCVPCCWRCNQMKSNMSIDEFRTIIRVIHERIRE